MKKGSIKALLIEDNPGDARLVQDMLAGPGVSNFDLEWADKLSKGIEYLKNNFVDIVLLDLSLPDGSGVETFEKLVRHVPHIPVIVLTGIDDEQIAIAALRSGLQDYLLKGSINGDMLARAIRYAIERKRLEEEIRLAHNELEMRVRQRTIELSDTNRALKEEIAERIKIEEELKESKSQAELYVDLMAHDINNMNQIAMGFLELAAECTAHDEDAKMLIDKPIEVLKNSSRLIDNVRKLQRIKFQVMQKKVVDIGTILADAVNQYSNLPGPEVRINYTEVKGFNVLANEFLVEVFANLIGNSIKHSRGDVSIDIMVSERSTGNGGDHFLVTIEDNGPGIADDMKDKIFNRYLRGDTKARGSGIGLYLVKTLVDDYGGDVWVEDRVSGDRHSGSKFLVSLPKI